MLVEFDKVSFSYPESDTPAVRELSFRIRPGEKIVLAGPSGSGKSTLLKLLAGILRPGSGQARLDGREASERSREAKGSRNKIGLLLQNPEDQLFAATARLDVAFGPKNRGLRGTELAARVDTAFKAVGLASALFADRSPFSLSGGETRKLAIAGVLAMRPELLVLDEPTAGLDPRGRKEILRHIEAAAAETGASILLVTHDPDEILTIADRILILSGGELHADGPVDKIMSDIDLLDSSGLVPARSTELLIALRERGLPILNITGGMEAAAKEILRAFAGGGIKS